MKEKCRLTFITMMTNIMYINCRVPAGIQSKLITRVQVRAGVLLKMKMGIQTLYRPQRTCISM